MKILNSVRNEVASFQIIKCYFDTYLLTLCEQDRVDLVFEFQAYMTERIYTAQQRVSEDNSFTFMGEQAIVANEVGHLANLRNQLCAVLFEVRTMALAYQSNAGISELRRCPHCGEIWAKLEGCNDATTCGNLMGRPDSRFGDLGTFTFEFDGKSFRIFKIGTKMLSSHQVSQGRAKGCGATIVEQNGTSSGAPRVSRDGRREHR